MTLAAQTELVPFVVRPMDKGDHGFVFGTWIRSYLTSGFARAIESEDYFHGQLRIVEDILERGVVRVAEYRDVGTLLGYAVGERHGRKPVLHYVYVKGDFRRTGIGRALEREVLKCVHVQGEPVRYTHRRSDFVPALAARRGYRWNPYCLQPPREDKKR